jgi:hypothetical protein
MNKRLIEVLKGKDAYQRKLVQMEIEALRLVLDEEKLDEDGRQKTRRWNDKSKLAAWIASQLFERAKRCEKIQQHPHTLGAALQEMVEQLGKPGMI